MENDTMRADSILGLKCLNDDFGVCVCAWSCSVSAMLTTNISVAPPGLSRASGCSPSKQRRDIARVLVRRQHIIDIGSACNSSKCDLVEASGGVSIDDNESSNAETAAAACTGFVSVPQASLSQTQEDGPANHYVLILLELLETSPLPLLFSIARLSMHARKGV